MRETLACQQHEQPVRDTEYIPGRMTSSKIRRIQEQLPPVQQWRVPQAAPTLLLLNRPWCLLPLLVHLRGPAKRKLRYDDDDSETQSLRSTQELTGLNGTWVERFKGCDPRPRAWCSAL